MRQIVRFFYNLQGIGDVLLVRLSNEDTVHTKTYGDVVELRSHDDELVGYNVFHASLAFDHVIDGGYFYNEETYHALQDILKQQQLPVLDADVSHKFFVGHISECTNHPKSDHLHICKVDIKTQVLDIVCGAANVEAGQRVVCAVHGAVLPDGTLLENSSLLGVFSQGMLCSYRELQIPISQPGIINLDETYVVGSEFHWKG